MAGLIPVQSNLLTDMNSIVLLSALCICSCHGGQLNSYLPPSGGVDSGAGNIKAHGYTGAAAFSAKGSAYAPSAPAIPILSYENNPNKGDGAYSYSYLTGNAIAGQESGQVASHKSGTEAQGSHSYTGPDGQQYTVTYTAGVNGFVPQGAHLPTPPPIPEEILKSLAFNADNPHSDNSIADSGSYSKSSTSYDTSSSGYDQGTTDGSSTGYQYRE